MKKFHFLVIKIIELEQILLQILLIILLKRLFFIYLNTTTIHKFKFYINKWLSKRRCKYYSKYNNDNNYLINTKNICKYIQ